MAVVRASGEVRDELEMPSALMATHVLIATMTSRMLGARLPYSFTTHQHANDNSSLDHDLVSLIESTGRRFDPRRAQRSKALSTIHSVAT